VCGEISPHNFVIDWASATVVSRRTTPQRMKFAFKPPVTGAAIATPTPTSTATPNTNPTTTGTSSDGSGKAKSAHGGDGVSGGKYVAFIPTSSDEQKSDSVTDDQLHQLMSLGLAVASHYRRPQVCSYLSARCT
jgi:hypothetical protein